MFAAAMFLATSAMSVPSFGESAVEYFWKRSVPDRLRGQEPVMATLNLWVEPNRKISRCSLGRWSGNEDVAKSLCPLFVNMRTEFPRDAQGKKTHGFVSIGFFGAYNHVDEEEWKRRSEEFYSKPVRGDPDERLAIIGYVPTPKESNEIIVGVAADGTATDCAGRGNMPEDIALEACKTATAKTYQVRYSTKGEAVSYVRNVRLTGQ